MDARAAVELCIVIIAIIFPKSLFFYIFNAKRFSLSLSLFLSFACVLSAAREQTKCARCRDRGARSFFLFLGGSHPKNEKMTDTLNITLSYFFFSEIMAKKLR